MLSLLLVNQLLILLIICNSFVASQLKLCGNWCCQTIKTLFLFNLDWIVAIQSRLLLLLLVNLSSVVAAIIYSNITRLMQCLSTKSRLLVNSSFVVIDGPKRLRRHCSCFQSTKNRLLLVNQISVVAVTNQPNTNHPRFRCC